MTCSSAVFGLAILEAAVHGELQTWSSSTLKFGIIKINDVTPTDVIPGAIVLGIVSGLLGAFFITVNFKVNALRAKYQTRKWHKPVDTFVFCFITASSVFWFSNFSQSCVPKQNLEEEGTFQAWCKDSETFNPLASLFWSTEGSIIRDIMSESQMCSIGQMVVFTSVWYFYTIITYGTNVPAGLFLPGMIIGCALGELYAHQCYNLGILDDVHY